MEPGRFDLKTFREAERRLSSPLLFFNSLSLYKTYSILKMKIELIVFDLDGTLVSSHDTIYKATLEALRRVDVDHSIDESGFYKQIGLHFEDIFRNFGFGVPDFEHFISIYKSIYFDYINSSTLYEGVEQLIDTVKAKGIKIALLTTKAQDQADLILKHFCLHDKFDYVMGRRPGLAHKPSPEPLLKICSDLNIDVCGAMIIGDSELDVECGKNAGTKSCAVTYGYRTKEDLMKSQPDFLVDNILEVGYILNGNHSAF